MFDLKDMFKNSLSTVDKVLMISHSKRDYKVINNLSAQVKKSVSFDQTVKIDSNGAFLTFNFQNFDTKFGQFCVLAQGKIKDAAIKP